VNERDLEKKKLKETLEIIKKVLEIEKDGLNKLYDTFIGSREDLWKEEANRKIHIKNIETSIERPYFARIDFQYSDRDKIEKIYIGKNGISKEGDIVVVDWRAPISSLYYDAEIGECTFKGPKELIHGNMSLKRQFEIENGELINYYDVDLVSNDSLLQKYLNTNNDSRLKSIVSTIQKEQNDVIRRGLSENLIIQGVAGSGKTTVALHRIAYLVYNYMKLLNQNQYLVIGPNPVFIKYIKSVLPELDVSSITQCTFEQFARNYLNEDIEINSSEKKVTNSISGKTDNDIDKFKCSMKYKYMLDQFLKKFIEELTSKDLKLGDFKVLDSKLITEIFNKSDVNNSLDVRIELTVERLCHYISDNRDNIISSYNNYSFEKFKTAISVDEKNKLRNEFSKDLEIIKKDCRSIIRKYFAEFRTNTIKIYKKFINTIGDYNLFEYPALSQLKKETLTNIKNERYDFEDLSALIYIKNNILGNADFSKIRHVVIDEAQDFGEFNFYVLKRIFPSATFSIFGDLAQSIYDYRGIDNWDVVNSIMFDNNGSIINFGKSYRTTAEIMEVADEVSSSIGLGKSDLVVRHGNDVTFTKLDSYDNIPEYIGDKILEYKSKGYKTIAIISKTNLLSCYINDDLKEKNINIPNVSIDDDVSEFEVCTISNQLAKGLEFDAVIINNASEQIYSSKNKLDMKLLYVAITRALHELDIIYTDELTMPLKKNLDKHEKTK